MPPAHSQLQFQCLDQRVPTCGIIELRRKLRPFKKACRSQFVRLRMLAALLAQTFPKPF